MTQQNQPDWRPGVRIGGRYQIEATLGEGGSGIVYKALHTDLKKYVAIKVSAKLESTSLAALREEAQLLTQLKHAHLPEVSDFFVEDQRPCLVMEFIEGRDLDQLSKAHGGKLGETETLHWIIQVAEALGYLHTREKPIVHRDVKPENILLRGNNEAVLVDFGIAKIGGGDTRTRVMAQGQGTPPYAPPEQYSGITGPYSDVYALGATLYVLLTGQYPPESVERQGNVKQMLPPRKCRPDLSPHIEQVILMAMALPANQRYQSAHEMLVALRADSAFTGATNRIQPVQCPRCRVYQSVSNPVFCQQCGAPIALRFPQASRLITSLADLVGCCDAEWDAGVEHLRSGRLLRWLEAHNELAHVARLQAYQVQYPDAPAIALEHFLRPPHQPANLGINRRELDFGACSPGQQPALKLVLQRSIPGYVSGQVEVTCDWLAVKPLAFQVRPGEPLPALEAQVKPENIVLGELEKTYAGSVKINTNRGIFDLPTRLIVRDPAHPEALPPTINLGKLDACRRIDSRAVLRNTGGGVVGGQVSSRHPWIMVESHQTRFSLRRGEQHTVNFSVDTRMLTPRGQHSGILLWETDNGNHVTHVQIDVTPPFHVDPHDPATAINQPEDLINLCDCVRGRDPHHWERGVALLRGGKLAAALRFFAKDALAHEADAYSQMNDPNRGLERLLRRLGAPPAIKYKDNSDTAIKQITGFLSARPAEVVYGILNTSKRGYLSGTIRPLVEWLKIPEPHFGCLPDQEAIITLCPDYDRRARLPFFGSVALFEVVLE